jgi:hypothetical protein
MFGRAVVPVAVFAAMLCSTMVVDAAEPILKLALQPGDMPATAKVIVSRPRPLDIETVEAFAASGVRGVQGAYYGYAWPINGTSKTSGDSIPNGWNVTGEVYQAPDESGAKRLFALGKRPLDKSRLGVGFESYGSFGREIKNLDLPSYGDEQFARGSTDPTDDLAVMVFVRKGTIVWQMLVSPSLTFKPTEAQMVAVLETYAPKQKARVDTR